MKNPNGYGTIKKLSGAMDWGPSIDGNTTGWNSISCGSGLRVIAIGY